MFFYTRLLLLLQPPVLWLSIGPLQLAIHVVRNRHAGKQVALGQEKQKTYIIWNGNFLCLSCPSATLASCKGPTVTFNNDAKLPLKWILREFSIANPTPAGRVTPPWNVYLPKFDPGWEGYPVWQTGLPALAGHPTYHVNVIKLKCEIIWTGGLPHLPGVPHLHVNRPLGIGQMSNFSRDEPNQGRLK